MFSFLKKKTPVAPPSPIVVPRIKHKNFLAAIESTGVPADSRPITESLVGDLLVTYAIDIGPSFMFVSPSNLTEHRLNTSELRALATTNALNAMRSITTRTDGTVHELTADENMAACSILFPRLWHQIEQELGGAVVVGFPHRDFVFYVRVDSPSAIAQLETVIGTIDFDDTHALSKHLYHLAGDEWRVFNK